MSNTNPVNNRKCPTCSGRLNRSAPHVAPLTGSMFRERCVRCNMDYDSANRLQVICETKTLRDDQHAFCHDVLMATLKLYEKKANTMW
jgi:hypothetical protein